MNAIKFAIEPEWKAEEKKKEGFEKSAQKASKICPELPDKMHKNLLTFLKIYM